MRHSIAAALTAASLLALAGCAASDHVLFVTKTSIGIDFDSKPGTASIGYDRVEGYVAPRYGNGEIPIVVASVKSDGQIFTPKIKQVYATGDAATVVSGGKRPTRNRQLRGDRELMFFGTTTAVGLKIGFTTGLPDSVVFGFKRKEFSYIPLATVGTGDNAYDVYPSVLASIDTQANVGSEQETGLNNSQFFATGSAALLLAANPGVREGFAKAAEEAVRAKQLANVQGTVRDDDEISTLVGKITSGFADEETTASQRQAIVETAKGVGIDTDNTMVAENFLQKLNRFSAADTLPAAQRRKKLQALQDKIMALLNH